MIVFEVIEITRGKKICNLHSKDNLTVKVIKLYLYLCIVYLHSTNIKLNLRITAQNPTDWMMNWF